MGLNCDFPGNDIQIIDYISKQSCISLCKKNKECTHFVWNPHLRNKCFIKKGKVLKSNSVLSAGWWKPELIGPVCGIVKEEQQKGKIFK